MEMDDESSQATSWFESGEVLAAFLSSTPLLLDSWRLCCLANTAAPGRFVVDLVGTIGYVAFSAIQGLSIGSPADMVPLGAAGPGLFPAFKASGGGGAGDEEEETSEAMVHAGMLQLFISFLNDTDLHSKISQLMQQCKSVVITGHSIGGATASLTALWLLCHLKSAFSSLPVLCITFGAPLLGNESLTNAILREQWGGRFCHIVSNHDIMPRLLFTPLSSSLSPIQQQLHFLLQFWHLSMASPTSQPPVLALTEQDINGFFWSVMGGIEAAASSPNGSGFWPFGSYLFCSEEGATCIDNANCIVKMLHLMLLSGSSPARSIEDHLLYGNYIGKVSYQFLPRRNFLSGMIMPDPSHEASISLELQSLGTQGKEPVSTMARDCLLMARRVGRARNINSANLAVRLSKIVPFRAEIEWYKACCDGQQGYYDAFKRRGASKRESRVNLNRIKLGTFWDDVMSMLEKNELPPDFHLRAKWRNASHFYKLLVEPLEIAEYYRLELHRTKGHYLEHGRERRFEVFDRWWKENERAANVSTGGNNNTNRSRFASLTQDSRFWAKVEEAWDWLYAVGNETDPAKSEFLMGRIRGFETYAKKLVEAKEVSEDVLAKNSTYILWVEKWRDLQHKTSSFLTINFSA